MSSINIKLDTLRNNDGTFDEPDVKALEQLTGKSFKNIAQQEDVQKGSMPSSGQITRKQLSNLTDDAYKALRPKIVSGELEISD